MSISWLENFLGRVAQPTYFRSNSAVEVQKDFETAQLLEGLELIERKISALERKRKDIIVIEVIESSIRRKSHMIRGCKLRIALSAHYHCPFLRSQAPPPPQKEHRLSLFHEMERRPKMPKSPKESEKAVIPYWSPTELDSKTMMLENEQKIQRYKKLRDSIKAALRVKKRLYSAVYRTPTEIWGIIFAFCLPSDEEYLEPTQDNAPLLLCRVSHTWRVAAIQTPSLWNSLLISLRGQKTRKAFLRTWISRSGALPLRLHVLWGPTQSLQFHDQIFDYLLTLAHRWRALRLSVVKGLVWQAHGFPTRAYHLLSYAMPALDTLELEPHLALGGAGLHRNAPRLRELRLLNATINPMHLMVASGGGWAQLASFRSQYPLDTAQALRVFKVCPNLVQCEFTVVSCPAGDPQRGTLIGMSVLKKLSIKETSAKVVDALIRLLEMPALEELNIEAEPWSFDSKALWSSKELLFMMRRSAGSQDEYKLKRLRVRGLIPDERFAKSVVFGIPSLAVFEMKNKEMDLSGQSWVELLRSTREKSKYTVTSLDSEWS